MLPSLTVFLLHLQVYASTERVEKKLTPDELVLVTKPITIATAKAVAAGNSCRQEDVIVAANMGRKAIFDLLRACKVRSYFRKYDQWFHGCCLQNHNECCANANANFEAAFFACVHLTVEMFGTRVLFVYLLKILLALIIGCAHSIPELLQIQ